MNEILDIVVAKTQSSCFSSPVGAEKPKPGRRARQKKFWMYQLALRMSEYIEVLVTHYVCADFSIVI